MKNTFVNLWKDKEGKRLMIFCAVFCLLIGLLPYLLLTLDYEKEFAFHWGGEFSMLFIAVITARLVVKLIPVSYADPKKESDRKEAMLYQGVMLLFAIIGLLIAYSIYLYL